jgi:hypothetical protein
MLNNTERRGFAIPMAILVIAVLTIMLVGGFSLVSAERRSVSDQKSQISAFRLAEQGLEIYLVRRDSLEAADPSWSKIPGAKDSVHIMLPGGYADVSLTRLRPPTGSQSGLYIARSKGTETAGVYAGTPQGVRTVAQYVLWESAPMQVLGAWTALSGFKKNGLAGTLSGIDLCKDSASVAGVIVPINPGYVGNTAAAGGIPPIDSVPPDSVHIDWNGIVNLGVITPAYTFTQASAWTAGSALGNLLVAAFGDTLSTFYPVIRVNGDFTLPTSGTGMLIVTGNLTISGSNGWHGVILAGGDITSNGNNGVYGATVSGLNVKLNMVVPISTGNGTKTYQYSSCEVAKATMGSGALVTLANTWVDNWVEY